MERNAREGRVDAFNVDRNRNESASIGETDLRQVQDRPAARRRAGDLSEPETQAAARVIGGVENW
jgi:hypothetical protein